MKAPYLSAMAAFGLTTTTSAFSVVSISQSAATVRTNTALNAKSESTRRQLLENAFFSTCATAAATLTLDISPANADTGAGSATVTNRIASQGALRYIKRSIKALEKLEFYASNNEYTEMKEGIRSPAINEIRKNAQILIRGQEEESSNRDSLVAAYESFKKDFEALDSQAGLALRGRKGISLYEPYANTMKGLVAFTAIAEKAISVPAEPAVVEESKVVESTPEPVTTEEPAVSV
jgi:hypothetical protein